MRLKDYNKPKVSERVRQSLFGAPPGPTSVTWLDARDLPGLVRQAAQGSPLTAAQTELAVKDISDLMNRMQGQMRREQVQELVKVFTTGIVAVPSACLKIEPTLKKGPAPGGKI